AFVANSATGNISIIDLDALVETASIGGFGPGISNIGINPLTHVGIVTNLNENTATFFSTSTGQSIGTISTGQRPRGVAFDGQSNRAVIVNANSNDAWIIDMVSRTVLARVNVGLGPTGVAIHPMTNSAVVTNSSVSRAGQNQFGAQGSISIVDLASHDVTN